MLHSGLERQASGSEALQQQPSAYLGTPPPPNIVLERIPEDSATHDAALSPQDLFPGKSCLHVAHDDATPLSSWHLRMLHDTHLRRVAWLERTSSVRDDGTVVHSSAQRGHR